ncbi:hypothetical protein EDD37DRAFT_495573 [Exophiala viscosa]|uniref:uncharacterized protein n=1 Tax=Exophiala viscosa TaxID=2486360 RepID=UPI0021917F0C|nr:hypothetical protein EDD37DRAFT_495573 [Exophiala viscosa]
MAGLSTPAPRQQPAKQMSSRLMNMKFMQRASVSTTSIPAASKTSTPVTEPVAKRRRVESETHSHSTSGPGTPYTPAASSQTSDAQTTTFGLSRGGISTFNRGECADTEWVLDLKMRAPKAKPEPRPNGTNGSRFDALEDDDDQEDEDDDDEDIWSHQHSGRQAYGSFKGKRKSRLQQNQNADDEGEDSASDASEDEEQNTSSRHTPSRKRQKNSSKDADSDEEMRQVRRAMEAKHGRMAATTPKSGGGGGGGRLPITGGHPGGGGGGHKRSREDGNYKMKKKARKTI